MTDTTERDETLTARLLAKSEAIRQWSDDDGAGYDQAIVLVSGACVLLEEVAAALTRESSARREAEQYIKACEAMLREHSSAAAVFQPGGRFHARANLRLGRSAVVEGIAWLTAQLDAAEQRAAQAASLARELHDSGDCGQMLHEIVAVLERP